MRILLIKIFIVATMLPAFAQRVDIGLFDGGNNTLEVRLKPTSDFEGIVSNVQFTIRWKKDTQADLGQPIQTMPEVAYIPVTKSGPAIEFNQYRYQVFAGFGIYPIQAFNKSWNANTEVVLLKIPVINGSGEFEIVNDQWTSDVLNNGNYYVSLGGENKTGFIYSNSVDLCYAMNNQTSVIQISCNGYNDGEIVLNPTGGTPPYNILWSNGSTSDHLTHLQAGNYSYTITDQLGCLITDEVELTEPAPVNPSTILLRHDTLFSNSNLNHQWYLNGNEIAGSDKPYHIVTESGSYQEKVYTDNGCYAWSNVIYVVYSGIENISPEFMVDINPNPNDGIFKFRFYAKTSGDYLFELSDPLGKAVYNDALKSFSGMFVKEFDVRNLLNKGVYILKVSGKENSTSIKIITN